MFQFRRLPAYAYLIQRTLTEVCSAGFPHSEICGSQDICSSPQLIAACHVLLRLLMPRHSPCALSSLTFRIISLILKVELCRQFNRIFEIVIVTHLYDVPQLKLKIRSFKLYVQKTSLLPCLSLLHYIVQFSRFDLPTAFAARFEDLSLCQVFKSNNNCCLVGPSGLEPPTLRLSVVRSSQLSYGPVPRRMCGVQAFCIAKPCRRANSLCPRILILRVPANAHAFVGWWR